MTVEIWHNPRCSKSRQTLALLREHGVEPTIVRYLDATPARERIAEVAGLLGDPHALVRRREAAYATSGLSSESDVDAVAAALHATPRLIERPVVIGPRGAAIGRPPERVLDVL